MNGDSDLTGLDLSTAARRMADGDLSSVELTQAYLDRIAAVDDHLHAWAYVDTDIAVRRSSNASSRRVVSPSARFPRV